jgi:branched-chain amino acid transport system ATP-binding protein
MLVIKDLQVSYGRKIRALHGVSLSVEQNEIVCLIGANGSGKSTLLKTVSGLLWPESGEIVFEGRRVDSCPAHSTADRGLVHVPEGRKIFPRLTVLENLELGAFARSTREARKELDRVIHLFPILGQRLRQWGGTLSGGEQQMLAMGRALMARPRLLMLDEPSMGLAPLVVKKIFEIIQDIHRSGTPILLVEQNANEALRIAQRGYVIETGRIALAGSAASLLADPRVRNTYLGVA